MTTNIKMPNYWILALKQFNHGKNTWCVAKKGTPENAQVREIMEKLKNAKQEVKEEVKVKDRDSQVKKGNKIPIKKDVKSEDTKPDKWYHRMDAEDVKRDEQNLNNEIESLIAKNGKKFSSYNPNGSKIEFYGLSRVRAADSINVLKVTNRNVKNENRLTYLTTENGILNSKKTKPIFKDKYGEYIIHDMDKQKTGHSSLKIHAFQLFDEKKHKYQEFMSNINPKININPK